MFEYMQSAAGFLASPRGPSGYSVPTAICIFNIPPNFLALDACNILAGDTRNSEVFKLLRNCITVPPVPIAKKKHDCWRLYLLGDFDHMTPLHQHFHLEPLDQYLLHNCGMDAPLFMELGPIQGLQAYIQLRDMYEDYYSSRDGRRTAPATTLPTDDSQGSPHDQNPKLPHTIVSAHGPRGEAWPAPTPSAELVVPSIHDFPPLSTTTAVTRASATSIPAEDSTLVSFKANMENYIQSILDKGLEAVRKETAVAIDNYQTKTDTALASMEQKLTQQQVCQTASDLQSRVDPINRTYESLRARQLSLNTMRRDLRRLGQPLMPQQQEEHDELALQIKTEQDEITKTSSKLRQRHAALLQEATLHNVRLEDLVDLDF